MQKRNHYLNLATIEFKKPDEPTQELQKLPITTSFQWKMFLLIAIVFLLGATTRFFYPREVILEKMVIQPVEIEKVVFQTRDIDPLSTVTALEESNFGILRVKDGEAQTIKNKKAAISSPLGFEVLKDRVGYEVHRYYLYQGTGYGLVSENGKNFFLLMWQTGQTPPPAVNPKSIFILSGKKVAIGTP